MDFWKTFISVLGTISGIVTLISFVFQIKDPCICIVIPYIVIVLGISFFLAWFLTRRKESLTISISNNLEIKIKSGDLFDYAKGQNYIVIPVNEYFDTEVNTKIVSASSLHGQFINKYYNCNSPKLHQEINDYLMQKGVEFKLDKNRSNNGGHTKKYPLGTCVPIQVGQVTFVLVALTHFDEEDHAYVELSEMGSCISSLCHFVSSEAGNNHVFMPLMGMGLSRINQSGQFILKYTLDTIVGVKDLTIPGGLKIIVYPPTAKTLDLNAIKY